MHSLLQYGVYRLCLRGASSRQWTQGYSCISDQRYIPLPQQRCDRKHWPAHDTANHLVLQRWPCECAILPYPRRYTLDCRMHRDAATGSAHGSDPKLQLVVLRQRLRAIPHANRPKRFDISRIMSDFNGLPEKAAQDPDPTWYSLKYTLTDDFRHKVTDVTEVE